MERYGEEEVPEGEPHEEIGVSTVVPRRVVLYALPVRHQDGQV